MVLTFIGIACIIEANTQRLRNTGLRYIVYSLSSLLVCWGVWKWGSELEAWTERKIQRYLYISELFKRRAEVQRILLNEFDQQIFGGSEWALKWCMFYICNKSDLCPEAIRTRLREPRLCCLMWPVFPTGSLFPVLEGERKGRKGVKSNNLAQDLNTAQELHSDMIMNASEGAGWMPTSYTGPLMRLMTSMYHRRHSK